MSARPHSVVVALEHRLRSLSTWPRSAIETMDRRLRSWFTRVRSALAAFFGLSGSRPGETGVWFNIPVMYSRVLSYLIPLYMRLFRKSTNHALVPWTFFRHSVYCNLDRSPLVCASPKRTFFPLLFSPPNNEPRKVAHCRLATLAIGPLPRPGFTSARPYEIDMAGRGHIAIISKRRHHS